MSDTSTKGPLAMTTDRVTALLDAYDAETTSLPLGHEMPTRGASTYNWRRSIVDELRALNAASPTSPAPAESGAVAAVLGSEDDLHSVAHALDIGSIGAPYRAVRGSVYCDYQSHRIADFQDYGLALAATVLFNNAKAIKAALASPAPSASMGRVTEEVIDALISACNQIEYLHGKFEETGSGNAMIASLTDLRRRLQRAALDSPPDHGGGETRGDTKRVGVYCYVLTDVGRAALDPKP